MVWLADFVISLVVVDYFVRFDVLFELIIGLIMFVGCFFLLICWVLFVWWFALFAIVFALL